MPANALCWWGCMESSRTMPPTWSGSGGRSSARTCRRASVRRSRTGPGTCARSSRTCRSRAASAPRRGGVAAAVTGAVVDADVVVRATSGAIQRAIAEADSPSPGSSTTVGLPEPVQRMLRRCPPTSRAGRPRARGPGRSRCAGLIAAADGRKRQHAEHGIQQPRLRRLDGRRRARTIIQTTSASSSGGQTQPSAVSARARSEDDEPGAGDGHRGGRDRRPALRPVGRSAPTARPAAPSRRRTRAGSRR